MKRPWNTGRLCTKKMVTPVTALLRAERFGVRIPLEVIDYLFSKTSRTTLWPYGTSDALWPSMTLLVLCFFHLIKLPGREAERCLPSSAQVKNECSFFPDMPWGSGQGQLYVYYASSCLPVLSRVVCYGKIIFLTECRVLRDPHGFLFGLSFLRISESLPSPKDFHVAFGQYGQIKGLSVKVIHDRVSPPPQLEFDVQGHLNIQPYNSELAMDWITRE
jgi:hypothetical protein